MVHVNSKNFDKSIIFCGRGHEKNNFLKELYLKNEKDKSAMFGIFDYPFLKFNKNIDSVYSSTQKFYTSKKEEIKWNDEFDVYAKGTLDFHYFSKKELYPVIHKMRTGVDIFDSLPENYFAFRNNINFNNSKLSGFSPFLKYFSNMLNNESSIKHHNHFSNVDLALKTNINKLNITDTLIKNEKLKNTILNNIAFSYLLEDQNRGNNQKFLEIYYNYSSDITNRNEIIKIGNAIESLKTGNLLPEVNLISPNDKLISSSSIAKKKTIIFFWTQNFSSHLIAAHKKIADLKNKYPEYQFIAINLDKDQLEWKKTLSKYKFDDIIELRSADFEEIRANWAIMKAHRTIILNQDGTIKNAFTNIFNADFEKNLK